MALSMRIEWAIGLKSSRAGADCVTVALANLYKLFAPYRSSFLSRRICQVKFCEAKI